MLPKVLGPLVCIPGEYTVIYCTYRVFIVYMISYKDLYYHIFRIFNGIKNPICIRNLKLPTLSLFVFFFFFSRSSPSRAAESRRGPLRSLSGVRLSTGPRCLRETVIFGVKTFFGK